MRRSRRPIVIASRRSHLARVQAEAVGRALQRVHPQLKVTYRWIESEGDRRLNVPLSEVGGKGLFVRAVEEALLRHQADLAVHSFKDLPVAAHELTLGLCIAAVPKRGPTQDCLIARDAASIAQLPQGAVVGTASPRRGAQLLRLRQDLQMSLIRGNVETRLRKVLEVQHYDATLLAAAGLIRSGLGSHATATLSLDEMLPAAGQGALALQCRADDHVTLTRCLPLNDPDTAAAVHAERLVVAGMDSDCHSAIAVLAEPIANQPGEFLMRARVLTEDGQQTVDARGQADSGNLTKLARQIVEDLRQRGAYELLHKPRPPQSMQPGLENQAGAAT